jgi:hypothetical protein
MECALSTCSSSSFQVLRCSTRIIRRQKLGSSAISARLAGFSRVLYPCFATLSGVAVRNFQRIPRNSKKVYEGYTRGISGCRPFLKFLGVEGDVTQILLSIDS